MIIGEIIVRNNSTTPNETTTYKGWLKWAPTNERLAELEVDHLPPFEMINNQYLLVYADHTFNYDQLLQQYCFENGKLRKFRRGSIRAAKQKKPSFESSKKAQDTVIFPRNAEQICAFDLIRDHTKTIKLLTGTWGSGKTLILVEAALEALRQKEFEKIIWIRNNIDVKDTKDLGALPGEVIDKLLPFLGPFIDHAGEDAVRTMLNQGTLVIEPLQSLRGRNFENTLIICSEAENLTKEHIQLIIARAAEGSEVWFDADSRQRDKAVFEKSKGIETLIERLAGNPLFGYVHLIQSERSATAALADLLNN